MDGVEILSGLHPVRRGVVLACPAGSSMTKQSFKAECDINEIVRKFVRTGVVEPKSLERRSAMFADVSGLDDYQSALHAIDAARAGFDTLPAGVRDRFGNDPAGLLVALANPANADEFVRLGLLRGPEAPPVDKGPVGNTVGPVGPGGSPEPGVTAPKVTS